MSVAIRTATRIRDQDDFGSTPGAGNDGYAVTWDNDTSQFVLASAAGGVTDHGALTGLADNDHTQYRQRITNWLLVDPAGKGDYTTIAAALAAVTSPTTSNRWLVDVLPGDYNETFTVPAYTVVRSVVAGQAVITAVGNIAGGITGNNVCVLAGAYGGVIGLSFVNTSLTVSSTAIWVTANNCVIDQCAITRTLSSGSGKTIAGIVLNTVITAVTNSAVAVRADSNVAYGVVNHYGTTCTLTNNSIQAIAYSGSGAAVYVSGGTPAIALVNSLIEYYGSSGYALNAPTGSFTVDRCRYSGGVNGTLTHLDRVRQNSADATFTPVSATVPPLAAKGFSGQTANLLDIQDSSANVLAQVAASGAATFKPRDAATSTITNGATVGHNSSGTPAAGFGTGLAFNAQSSTTASQNAALIAAQWIVATHASRTARLALSAYDYNGAREGVRIDTDGSAALLGFYGHAAVAQQVLATGAGATVDNVISALQALGLVKQS